MADVQLNIKVRDRDEIDKTTASLDRLNKAANNVNQTGSSSANAFGGKKAEESLSQQQKLAAFMERNMPQAAQKAVQATQQVADATSQVGTASVAAGEGITALGVAVGATVLAIGAFVVALILVAKLAYDAANAFAQFALQLRDMSEQTGLASSTMAGLKLEFEAQGRSINDLNGPLDNFRKLIGQAAAGSAEAEKTLNSWGLSGRTSINNIDAAFQTVLERIAAAPNEIDRIKIAFDAFGEDGARKLIPFLKDAHGNLDELRKQAARFGLQVSGKSLEDAKAYTRAVADLDASFQGLKNTLGTTFIEIVTAAINKLTALVQLARQFPTQLLAGGVGAATLTQEQIDNAVNPQTTPGQISPALDPAAAAAMLQEQEKAQKAVLDKYKQDIDEAIAYVKAKGGDLQSNLERVFEVIKENFEKSGDTAAFQKQVDDLINEYIKKVTIFENILKDLEKRKSAAAPPTAIGAKALADEQARRQQEDVDKYVDIQKKAADLIEKYNEQKAREKEQQDKAAAAAEKRAILDHLNDVAAEMSQILQLREAELELDHYINQKQFDDGIKTEREYVDYLRQSALDTIALRKWALQQEIDATQKAVDERGDIEGQLNKRLIALRGQMKIAEEQEKNAQTIPALTTEQQIRQHINKLLSDNIDLIKERRSLAKTTEEDSLVSRLTELNDELSRGGANDALKIAVEHAQDLLDLRNKELDAVIRINRAQLELDHQMDISNNQIRAGVLEHLASQKSLNQAIVDGINGTYDAITKGMDAPLDKLNEKTKGLLSFVIEPLKALQHRAVTNVFKNVLDAIFPGLGDIATETSNPVAAPIVDKLKETNQLLGQLVSATGQVPATRSVGLGGVGGGIGGFLQRILGGGSSGPGGTPPFIGNLVGGGTSSGIGPTGSIDANGNYVVNGSQSGGIGGIFGNLRQIFTTKPGGIFGKQGFGNNQGTYDAISAIASVAGGLIGGRAGNIIGLAGQGLSLGFMFGGPIGAAIGAGIGALVGIFMGDPKKKQDKNESIPKLQQGFSDAMTQLTQILQDIRSLSMDPDAGVAKAREIRAQIAGGFGVQFGSKWGQKQSASLIAQELAAIDRQPDGLMAQILAAAQIAKGAADRSKRIIPEFAGGWFADYFRPNGLVPGAFDGADNILAMISRGEAVLNPAQMARARAAAGFDVFAHAGIPNYPNAVSTPKLAGGGIAGAGIMQAPIVHNNVTLIAEGVTFDDRSRVWLESDDGQRTLVNMIQKRKKSGDI